MPRTRLLSEQDVAEHLDMDDVIYGVERTYEEKGKGKVINPSKLGLDLGESGGWPHYNSFMNAMPAYVDWIDSAGLKWAGGFWDNHERDLPPISGLILLVNPRKGNFRAVVEGGYITALRTGAQTAVGAKHLRSDVKTVGIFGAGTQARYNGIALDTVLDLDRIRVYDIRESEAKAYVDEVQDTVDATVEYTTEPAAAAASELIVTVTTAKEPFLESEWIDDGTLIAALGSYQELYPETIQAADSIVVDHVEQCLHRGALMHQAEQGNITEADIDATIGEVIANGGTFDGETTIFVPIGIGALDVSVATQVYNRAKETESVETFGFVS